MTAAAKTGLVLAGVVLAVSLLKMFEPTDTLPPVPPAALRYAREQFVTEHRGRDLISEDGFGQCRLGPEDSTLICGVHDSGPYVRMDGWHIISTDSVDWLRELCGRGFQKLVIRGSENQLDCRPYPAWVRTPGNQK